MANEQADEQKDSSEVYAISSPSASTESFVSASDHADIFAVKKEHSDRLGSLIGLSLGAGIFLCHAYRLDKLIDHDEQGEIWKASDLRSSKNVRIYLPPLEMRKDPSAIELLKQHARQIEALDHPRIVQSLDHFIDPEHGFFTVQKSVAGKTLNVFWQEHIRKQGKLDSAKAVKILTEIARPLDYAHGIEIAHSNLSPKAIIINPDESVYVSRFALVSLPYDPMRAGRQAYTAPEIFQGSLPNRLSDLFSFAVMAYELFSGRLPNLSDSIESSFPLPGVPSTVDAVIQKALSKVPEDRYDSCGAFVKALEAGFKQPKEVKPVSIKPAAAVHSSVSVLRLFAGMMLLLLFFIAATAVWFPEYLDREYLAQMITSIPNPSALPLSEESGNAVLEDRPSPSTEGELSAFPSSEDHPSPSTEGELSAFPSSEDHPSPSTEGELSAFPSSEDRPSPSTEGELSAFQNIPVPIVSLPAKGERGEIIINFVKYPFRWCPYSANSSEGFWILEKAVTQEMWESIMGVDYQPDYGPQLPVRNVSWEKCQRFIEIVGSDPVWQTQKMFSGFHPALPTESQWNQALQDGMIASEDGFYEWCNDWFDQEKRYRAVLGNERINRDPASRTGYVNVGFRLVLERDTLE